LSEARSVLIGACNRAVRLVEVGQRPDLSLIAGAGDWAEGVIRQSRGVGDPIPIVVLNVTAEGGANARILDAGADDCLACPFDPGELRARIQAVMRRQGSSLTHCPPIAADFDTRRIRVHDFEVRVSPKQFEIFVYLAERRERWVHSSEIIAAISGTHHDPGTSLVRVQIHALRKAFGAARDCIRCDGRKSYMLTLAAAE
jgi:DNA-binding response OmpR family regulator